MNCSSFQEQLSRSVALGGSDGREVLAEHAAGCLACRRLMHDWEEAQRAIEVGLAPPKDQLQRYQTMSDSLYVEQFGSAIEVRPRAEREPSPAITALPPGTPWPLLAAAVGGLLMGYVVWGQQTQSPRTLEQALMQQAILSGGGWGGMGGMGGGWAGASPGIAAAQTVLGTVTNIARDLFALFLIIWICRSQIWNMVFPTRLPRGLLMARLIVMPLAIVAILKLVITCLIAIALVGAQNTGLGSADLQLYTAVHMLLSVVWSCGFWVILLLILFMVFEHVAARYVASLQTR